MLHSTYGQTFAARTPFRMPMVTHAHQALSNTPNLLHFSSEAPDEEPYDTNKLKLNTLDYPIMWLLSYGMLTPWIARAIHKRQKPEQPPLMSLKSFKKMALD